MTTGRIYRAGLADVPANAPKGRIYRAGLTGTAPAASKGRIYRAGFTGAASVVLNSLPDQTVEPESTVSLTANLQGGGTANSYTWRRISGPTIGIQGTGQTVTFTAPSMMPADTVPVVVGVTATVAGVTSSERTCTITIYPQLQWAWNGSKFIGSPLVGV